MIRRSTVLLLAVLTLAAGGLRAQNAAEPGNIMGQVVLTKLGPVAYPVIAKTAHITGDVGVDLKIKQDGTIESANAVSGPVLLWRVAMQSAQQSKFECRKCSTVTAYHLIYSFHLVYPKLSSEEQADCFRTYPAQVAPSVVLSGNHVTFTDGLEAYVDCVQSFKVRSWKCLYLWSCGSRL